MALIINRNMMSENALRNLGNTYKKLGTSVQRLSSGLRINSAADDAAGLAIREMMRTDISVIHQGVRNAADAITMIQTADGALAVIDEKLIRMKELAEQASTGTYTTIQRDIINSEYQAMAREIDRIASATNFSGIKLLDGSISNQHGGQGLKVHFGVGNNQAEDYYFINIGDARATSSTGLRVGGDAKNDIWAQGGAGKIYGSAAGCCSGGFAGLDINGVFKNNQAFSYGYNWDWQAGDETALVGGKYTAGLYRVSSGDTLQNLINQVNAGTQSRVGIVFGSAGTVSGSGVAVTSVYNGGMSAFAICIGDETYAWGSASAIKNAFGSGKAKVLTGAKTGTDLTNAINLSSSNFWAMWERATNTCYVFARTGGDNNNLRACERALAIASASAAQVGQNLVSFINIGADQTNSSGANFSLGGEKWGVLKPLQTTAGPNEAWNVALEGRDVGSGRDLWIHNIGSRKTDELSTSSTAKYSLLGMPAALASITNLDRDAFFEVQNAADALWRGAEIRTQSSAQEALDAITQAIVQKDRIRAQLGAIQNRLENTMTNLEIQAENLQTAESRISDVDVAKEMTEFTKNSVLTQAAVSMLAQANSLNQLALNLLG